MDTNINENKNVPKSKASSGQVERFFDDVVNLFKPGHPLHWPGRFSAPSVDVEDNDQEYLISVDLPGFKIEEIKVESTNNQLSISAEREETEKKRRESHRFYGSFYKSVTLPRGVDPAHIRADYDNGVLMVHVPRGDEDRPKRIEITRSPGQKTSAPPKAAH